MGSPFEVTGAAHDPVAGQTLVRVEGFEAAVARDYPVMFGTMYIFGLMSLVVGIISDLMYVLVDPRIDFEKREG